MDERDTVIQGAMSGDWVACARCGVPCRRTPPVHPDARILRATTADRGLCPSCGLTAFLKDLPATQLGIDRAGGIAPLLAAPHIREGILAMMRTGNADAGPEQIDWERVARNWELPDPAPRKAKGKKRG